MKAIIVGVLALMCCFVVFSCPPKVVIDCDADPFVPDGWQVEEHIKGGQLSWNPDEVELYICEEQKNFGGIDGHELRQLLQDKPVLNANVLDYLLAHTELIPKKWKENATFFWGTIYCDSFGCLCIRYLFWSGDRWVWRYHWLGGYFLRHSPAALSCLPAGR